MKFVIIFCFINFSLFCQQKSKELKYITKSEYLKILKESSCKQLNAGNLSWQELPHSINYLECNESFYIKEDNDNNKIILYNNKQQFLESLSLQDRYILMSPLKGLDEIITDIEANEGKLISQLLDKLEINLENKTLLSSINFDLMNSRIKNIEDSVSLYDKFFLNFIVFFGNLVKENKGGHWEYETNSDRPTELDIYFVDNKGNNYYFLINVLLTREFSKLINKEEGFDIRKIIRVLFLDLNKLKAKPDDSPDGARMSKR